VFKPEIVTNKVKDKDKLSLLVKETFLMLLHNLKDMVIKPMFNSQVPTNPSLEDQVVILHGDMILPGAMLPNLNGDLNSELI